MSKYMKKKLLGSVICVAAMMLLTTLSFGQSAPAGDKKPLSPPAQAKVILKGQTITIDYSAPSMRGRKIMGGLVPLGKVWRTGANAATTLKTPIPLHIGDLAVAPGTYTLYTIPSESGWTLIVSKQTGQWGTIYEETNDLGRVPMETNSVSKPVEIFLIHFEKTSGSQTSLHLTWETTDSSVPLSAD